MASDGGNKGLLAKAARAARAARSKLTRKKSGSQTSQQKPTEEFSNPMHQSPEQLQWELRVLSKINEISNTDGTGVMSEKQISRFYKRAIQELAGQKSPGVIDPTLFALEVTMAKPQAQKLFVSRRDSGIVADAAQEEFNKKYLLMLCSSSQTSEEFEKANEKILAKLKGSENIIIPAEKDIQGLIDNLDQTMINQLLPLNLARKAAIIAKQGQLEYCKADDSLADELAKATDDPSKEAALKVYFDEAKTPIKHRPSLSALQEARQEYVAQRDADRGQLMNYAPYEKKALRDYDTPKEAYQKYVEAITSLNAVEGSEKLTLHSEQYFTSMFNEEKAAIQAAKVRDFSVARRPKAPDPGQAPGQAAATRPQQALPYSDASIMRPNPEYAPALKGTEAQPAKSFSMPDISDYTKASVVLAGQQSTSSGQEHQELTEDQKLEVAKIAAEKWPKQVLHDIAMHKDTGGSEMYATSTRNKAGRSGIITRLLAVQEIAEESLYKQMDANKQSSARAFIQENPTFAKKFASPRSLEAAAVEAIKELHTPPTNIVEIPHVNGIVCTDIIAVYNHDKRDSTDKLKEILLSPEFTDMIAAGTNIAQAINTHNKIDEKDRELASELAATNEFKAHFTQIAAAKGNVLYEDISVVRGGGTEEPLGVGSDAVREVSSDSVYATVTAKPADIEKQMTQEQRVAANFILLSEDFAHRPDYSTEGRTAFEDSIEYHNNKEYNTGGITAEQLGAYSVIHQKEIKAAKEAEVARKAAEAQKQEAQRVVVEPVESIYGNQEAIQKQKRSEAVVGLKKETPDIQKSYVAHVGALKKHVITQNGDIFKAATEYLTELEKTSGKDKAGDASLYAAAYIHTETRKYGNMYKSLTPKEGATKVRKGYLEKNGHECPFTNEEIVQARQDLEKEKSQAQAAVIQEGLGTKSPERQPSRRVSGELSPEDQKALEEATITLAAAKRPGHEPAHHTPERQQVKPRVKRGITDNSPL